ncbi:chalcone isomerase family protein [Colwellia hornerae]|uniref:Chalcone isomerase domain-containing protein n=1 Tax=Colwellia hornerae TaxID=89402 RepID=A0A5C6QM46_9GAMM|nr:chalcone isomerase family protein [Colwellia hornerae]TWX53639.1 hypothetical protein ESZ28_09130 [Colwellia hornerae]TWX60290.1 hypothetical protein ESZ26_07905 [Colwellia hornerae]TWX70045.1 hypothetical protein ESZ27_04595 [Colwellia hornerae]
MFKFYARLIVIIMLQQFITVQVLATDDIKPDTLDNILKEQVYIPVGETTFSVLFWDLYKSKLLTTSGKYPLKSTNEKLLYQINYLTDISSEDLIERTVEQWQHLGVPRINFQHYLPMLEKMWPDIKEGDSLSLYVINNKSTFYFNNNIIGKIDQQEFSQLFLDIWLSTNTSEPKLRLELLGINKDE